MQRACQNDNHSIKFFTGMQHFFYMFSTGYSQINSQVKTGVNNSVDSLFNIL